MATIDSDARPSPNIWRFPEVYEIENRGVDPDGVVEDTISSIRPWSGADVVDLGCGSGFHLPRFAASARSVVGVEPHGGLVGLARRRCRGLANVTVKQGSAQSVPLPDNSADLVQARWAYFFGPGCEPGFAELHRVIRRHGVAVVIDVDATRSTFGTWFTRARPDYDARAVDAFFARHGWERLERDIRWELDSRTDFEAVVRIEFAPDQAERILAEHTGSSVDYAIVVRVHRY